MPIRRVEALQLGELLGSLLASVVEAQQQAARATVEFIGEVGFETTTDGERMRTVTLRYTKKDENGQPAEFEVGVPLLAMVNVPSLMVKEAKLSFSYDVVTSESQEAQARPSGSGASPRAGASSSAGLPRMSLTERVRSVSTLQPARITGYIRRRPQDAAVAERRTTAIDVDVTLEQQPMPVGVERLFDLAELGITERPADEGGST
jgi:hypothetical protein